MIGEIQKRRRSRAGNPKKEEKSATFACSTNCPVKATQI